MAFSRQIVSVVAAMLLAAHVVVGCCAHHAHAKLPLGHELGAEWQAAEGHRCTHHGAESSAPTDEDSDGESCGEGSCMFLAGGKIVLPELSQPAGLVADWDAMHLHLLAPASFGGDHLFERPRLPQLRSHLSKCVLVV